jgi:2Fe-2S ferredoxin
MPTVLVRPLDADIEVLEGESLMRAAQRQGLWWPTVCDGNCECGTCWVVVEEGWEHCSPMAPAERARLDRGMKANESRARLACQVRMWGPVTVTRRSVRRTETVTSKGGVT